MPMYWWNRNMQVRSLPSYFKLKYPWGWTIHLNYVQPPVQGRAMSNLPTEINLFSRHHPSTLWVEVLRCWSRGAGSWLETKTRKIVQPKRKTISIFCCSLTNYDKRVSHRPCLRSKVSKGIPLDETMLVMGCRLGWLVLLGYPLGLGLVLGFTNTKDL
jgi:hypothetical protein